MVGDINNGLLCATGNRTDLSAGISILRETFRVYFKKGHAFNFNPSMSVNLQNVTTLNLFRFENYSLRIDELLLDLFGTLRIMNVIYGEDRELNNLHFLLFSDRVTLLCEYCIYTVGGIVCRWTGRTIYRSKPSNNTGF